MRLKTTSAAAFELKTVRGHLRGRHFGRVWRGRWIRKGQFCLHRAFIHADVDYALAPMTTPTRRGGDRPRTSSSARSAAAKASARSDDRRGNQDGESRVSGVSASVERNLARRRIEAAPVVIRDMRVRLLSARPDRVSHVQRSRVHERHPDIDAGAADSISSIEGKVGIGYEERVRASDCR
jgi:hypothetical protein